ncbi:MAG: hypothetical protein GPJ52_04560 [Candidatus Heimdallarchaeota archaeon]|nr:hypothetical protein [Candidatus Heimdallarchaeota archaeon]
MVDDIQSEVILKPKDSWKVLDNVYFCTLHSFGGITNGASYYEWLSTMCNQDYIRVLREQNYKENKTLGAYWNDACFEISIKHETIDLLNQRFLILCNVRSIYADQKVQVFVGSNHQFDVMCYANQTRNISIIVDATHDKFNIFLRPTETVRLNLYKVGIYLI